MPYLQLVVLLLVLVPVLVPLLRQQLGGRQIRLVLVPVLVPLLRRRLNPTLAVIVWERGWSRRDLRSQIEISVMES